MSQISKKFLESNSVDGTKIRLSNNQALRARNVANSADIDMFRLSTSNLTQILTTLVPDTSNTRDLGTDVNRFATIYGKDIQACLFSGTGRLLTADGSLTNQMELFSVSGSTPSGESVTSHIRTMVASNKLGLYTTNDATADANPTGKLVIETGNKTAGTGNSGGILLQTGTSSGGTRGTVDINGSQINFTGNFVPTASSFNIGSSSFQLSQIHSNQFRVYSSGTLYGILLRTSLPSGDPSAAVLYGGTSGSISSPVGLMTESVSSTTGTGTGVVNIETGNATGAGGPVPSGIIRIKTGNTTNILNNSNTGNISIETGNAAGSTSGDSGDILLQTGTSSSGTRGIISLDASEVDVNSVKIINLATPISGSDAANKSYVDSAAIYVTGDLGQVSFSLANNQSTYSDVTGVAFANGTSRSAEVHYSIYVNATSSLYESGKLRLIQKGSSWAIARSMVGDDALVDFDVTTSGQLQYKTANYSGFSAATLKCRAITTSV